MRAVIYARFSTDMQRDASIEDQVRVCRERIERDGHTLGTVYQDKALSGSSTLRPGYQAMLLDARMGKFDIVVAEALDRLSRDQEDVAALFKNLSFASVGVLTLAEGVISELHVGLTGTMNALFIKNLAAKTHRGLLGRVTAGKSGGGKAYGYDVVKRFDSEGERIRGDRTINDVEAAVVYRIMTEYAAGRSPRAIAIGLNADRIPGPNGGEWGPSTINGNRERGTGIVNNELYIGRLVWNRLRYVNDPRTGKRVSRHNAAEELVVTEVPELRIVPQELWDKVRDRQAALDARIPGDRQERPFWEKHRPRHLITGLAKCGCCGSSYVKVNKTRFGCAASKDRGTCTNKMTIDGEVLENTILDLLKTQLMAPDAVKAFADEFARELNRLRIEASSTVEAQRIELKKVERQIDQIVTMVADGAPGARSMTEKLPALEDRQDALRAALADTKPPEPFLHPAMSDIYRRQVAALHEALGTPDSRDGAFDLIRSLIEEIKLTPAEGTLQIELRGALAGILSLCSGTTKAAPGGTAVAEQIKMVAGIGFEPMTFRL